MLIRRLSPLYLAFALLLASSTAARAQWVSDNNGGIVYPGTAAVGAPAPVNTKFAVFGRSYLGQVGIGVVPSQALLEIADLFSAGGRNLQVGNDTFFTDIDLPNVLGLYGAQDSTRATLQLGSNGATLSGRFGRLGVGTYDPLERLQLGDRFTFHDGGTKVLGLNSHWTNAGDTRIVSGGVAQIRFNNDGSLQLLTAPTGAAGSVISYTHSGMVMTPDGRVGFGYTQPQAQVEIADLYAAGGRNLQIGNDTFFTDIDQANVLGLYGAQDSTRAALRLGANGPTIAGRSGNLGIGTNSPSEKLEVAGNIKLAGNIVSDGDICIGNCQ